MEGLALPKLVEILQVLPKLVEGQVLPKLVEGLVLPKLVEILHEGRRRRLLHKLRRLLALLVVLVQMEEHMEVLKFLQGTKHLEAMSRAMNTRSWALHASRSSPT